MRADVEAAHSGRATGGLDQRGEHPDDGGLAGAVGAEEGEHVAALDGEVEVVDCGERPELAGQPVRLDDGGGGLHGCPFVLSDETYSDCRNTASVRFGYHPGMAQRDGDARGRVPRAFTDMIRAIQTAHESTDATTGLRERKKAQLRQHISDTATMMFLDRGFDAVRVSEVAAACDVSEKTVFNYFPTKESLLFDNTDRIADAIRESVRDHRDGRSIAGAAHAAAVSEFDRIHAYWQAGDESAVLEVVRRFGALIEETPALRAAQHSVLDRLVDVAADALGERAGVDPLDPEPQVAALAIVGIWRVQFLSLRRHARTASTVHDLRVAVLGDVERAAMLAEAGLNSFDSAIATSRRPAGAAAADDARKHVAAAVRHAREAWRIAKAVHDAEHGSDRDDHVDAIRDETKRYRSEMARLKRRHDADGMRREAERHQAEMQRLKRGIRATHSNRGDRTSR